MKRRSAVWSVLVVAAGWAWAETVKDREGAVRSDAASVGQDARWVYNDVERGFEEARKTGKPLMVVLRCVPCLACGGLDAQVLDRAGELGTTLDPFVCVRVINANALDLSRFQFDYDLSFSALFFNGDGTLYGRFGSWQHQTNSQERAVQGFRKTLGAVLEVHRGYPGNREELRGKQGKPVTYRTPVQMPTLAGKYGPELDWKGRVVPSCVHCHQIGDAYRTAARERGDQVPVEWIYPHPSPEVLGIELDSREMARVLRVAVGSPGARAGLQAGDDLLRVNGQRILSPADVRWVLDGAPEKGTLEVEISRGPAGNRARLQLDLPDRWRHRSDISRRVGTWEMRAMALGGLLLEDVSDVERTQAGLGTAGMALRVKHAGEYGRHAVAKKAGVQKEDVLVEVDGQTGRMSESELIGNLLGAHRAGDSVRMVVQRGGQLINVVIAQQ